MKPTTWIALGLALVILASLAVALPLGAQQAAALKIAIIDGDRVIQESNIGRSIQEQAGQKQQEWQSRIEAKQDEIDGLVRQGQEQALTLNEEALARLNADIEEGRIELQRMRDDANRELQRLQMQLQNQMNSLLVPAVERLAQQDGFDLVLDKRLTGILYSSDTIDVTNRFIAMVNAEPGTSAEPGRDSD